MSFNGADADLGRASTMGSMTAYWSTYSRMDYLDPDLFVTEMATMSQICGNLMLADVAAIKSAPSDPGSGRGRGAIADPV